MNVIVIEESGYEAALLGLSLSYNSEPSEAVAKKLCFKGDGHNKFLEMMDIKLDITAPRMWWSHTDAYRIGITKQSESTMHTILSRPLTQNDFVVPIPECYLAELNAHIVNKDLRTVKAWLPEGFLQRRIVATNYMSLQRVIRQRRSHKLYEWQDFCDRVIEQAKHPEFLEEINDS